MLTLEKDSSKTDSGNTSSHTFTPTPNVKKGFRRKKGDSPFIYNLNLKVKKEKKQSNVTNPDPWARIVGSRNTAAIYVVPPQSWGDRSDTKHSKCLLLGGRRLNQLTLIPKPKGSGGARAAMDQVGPANNRNDTKRCLPIEASLRPGEAVPW